MSSLNNSESPKDDEEIQTIRLEFRLTPKYRHLQNAPVAEFESCNTEPLLRISFAGDASSKAPGKQDEPHPKNKDSEPPAASANQSN